MPYLDKDFKPSLFEYTNVNDYNRLLVYYPAKAKRRGEAPIPTPSATPITPTPTPTSTITPTPSPSPVFYHIEAQNGDLIITQGGDFIDWFPL